MLRGSTTLLALVALAPACFTADGNNPGTGASTSTTYCFEQALPP